MNSKSTLIGKLQVDRDQAVLHFHIDAINKEIADGKLPSSFRAK